MAKKSQKPTPKYDSQRETRVLLEQIHSEVKVVSEQYGSITKNLHSINSELERVKVAVMENSLQIKGLKVGQESLRVEFGEMKVGQEELRAGQEDLRAEFSEMKVGQERIEKKLDDNLANHDQRIRRLEEKVGI